MRGREDHAAANQRALHALNQARRRLVAECQTELIPDLPFFDRAVPDPEHFSVPEVWDRLNVGYLRAEWPPSMLS